MQLLIVFIQLSKLCNFPQILYNSGYNFYSSFKEQNSYAKSAKRPEDGILISLKEGKKEHTRARGADGYSKVFPRQG